MNPHIFLRSLLLVPILVPLLVWGMAAALPGSFRSGNSAMMVLVLSSSLVIGGLAYIATAAILWFRIGRCTSQKSAMALIFKAPLFFAPMQVLAWWLWALSQPPDPATVGIGADYTTYVVYAFEFGMGLIMAFYGLLLGYFYAACAAIIFLGAVRVGLVFGFASEELHSTNANAA